MKCLLISTVIQGVIDNFLEVQFAAENPLLLREFHLQHPFETLHIDPMIIYNLRSKCRYVFSVNRNTKPCNA